MDAVNPLAQIADVNKSFNERHAHTVRSKTVAMQGRIHSDLFTQERYILGAVPLN